MKWRENLLNFFVTPPPPLNTPQLKKVSTKYDFHEFRRAHYLPLRSCAYEKNYIIYQIRIYGHYLKKSVNMADRFLIFVYCY